MDFNTEKTRLGDSVVYFGTPEYEAIVKMIPIGSVLQGKTIDAKVILKFGDDLGIAEHTIRWLLQTVRKKEPGHKPTETEYWVGNPIRRNLSQSSKKKAEDKHGNEGL